MITKTSRNPVDSSVSIYRFLLAAYPQAFREEYGDDMVQVFRDFCIRAYLNQGPNGMFRLWATTLLDLIRSVIEEHLQKETNMNKSSYIRVSGWALILGALSFFMTFLSIFMEENFYDPALRIIGFYKTTQDVGIVLSPLLLGAGMFGLRAKYGDRSGETGKTLLLLGGILGPLTAIAGWIGADKAENMWFLIFLGPAILLAFLTAFGFVTLKSKPLPRWNWLPILAGAWFPIAIFTYLINPDFVEGLQPWLEIGFMIQAIAMLILGYYLQTRRVQNPSLSTT